MELNNCYFVKIAKNYVHVYFQWLMEKMRIEVLQDLQGKNQRGGDGWIDRPTFPLNRSKSILPSYDPPPSYEEALKIKKYYYAR